MPTQEASDDVLCDDVGRDEIGPPQIYDASANTVQLCPQNYLLQLRL